jgi:hypothetical protein
VQPEQIAERIWPGRELVLEPLGGGLTNQNFKVAVDGEICVLRIGGKDSELLAIDRVVERGASLVASELGIGPEVVGFVEPEGYLLYFGVLRDEDARALRLMRFMSDFREAMWGVVQQGVSDLDVDYVGWASQHFDRMLRTGEEEAFQVALEPVR